MDEIPANLHLLVSLFLYQMSSLAVAPAMTDIFMAAFCPEQDECSLVIYLNGFQQMISGIGSLVVSPLVGSLADMFGTKSLLTIPMVIGIAPSAVLSFSRTKQFVIVYYITRTLSSIICDGSIICLSLVYVINNTSESRRMSAIGVLAGTTSCAFICATIASRFLSKSMIFQVSAALGLVAVIYMRALLREPANYSWAAWANLSSASRTRRRHHCTTGSKMDSMAGQSTGRAPDDPSLIPLKNIPSLRQIISLWKTSPSFSQASVIAFLATLGDSGLQSSLLYYLRVQFQFHKDQFAELMLISGTVGATSQLFLMPILADFMGEERLLKVGLLANCAHDFLYALAWDTWVPYLAAFFGLMTVFVSPCVRSIVSKQVGPDEQGKAQGCISGICSLASSMSPLAMTPLTALFLSEKAPFHFPGFSIMSVGFVMMLAFIQSCVMRSFPPIPLTRT